MSPICNLLHRKTNRCPRLVSVIVTDRGKSVCRSHSESKENAALLVSQFQMAVASTVFSISVLKPAPFSFAPFWIPQFLKTNHHRFFTSLMWILCFSWSSHMHLSKWCSFHRFLKNLILITEVITWHVNQPRKPDFCRWLDREVFILCFKKKCFICFRVCVVSRKWSFEAP